MRVAVINTTFLNGGDAAINMGTMAILRRVWGDATEFVFFDAQPETSRAMYPGLNIRASVFDRIAAAVRHPLPRKFALLGVLALARIFRHRARGRRDSGFLRLLGDYATADVVVSAGGTYLVDRYRIAPRLFEFLVVLALGRPLVLFTQSIGPLTRWRDRAILGWVLQRTALAMVRDDRSRRELLSLGMPAEAIVTCPDAAFALLPAGRQQRVCRESNPLRIAVSVRDWPFMKDKDGMTMYLEAMAGFIRRLVEIDGAQVTMLSTCQGVGAYWTDDSRMAQLIVCRLPPHVRANVALDEAFHSPRDLIERLGSFDCVVATRMHMAILSLCAGRPVVPIAYEFKTRELFASMRFAIPVSDIVSVSSESLYDAWRVAARQLARGCRDDGWQCVEDASRQALDSGRLVAAALERAAVR